MTRRMALSLMAAILSALLAVPWNIGHAGPNAGGVLILHTNESLIYPTGSPYCDQSGLASCWGADVRTDSTDPRVFFVLAAFPDVAQPRMISVMFGINYDSTAVTIVDFGSCSDYEFHTDGWPGTGEGTVLSWNVAQTAHLRTVYWFVAMDYWATPVTFSVMGFPDQGGYFGGDDPEMPVDPIADYGRLGFNTDGHLPCPSPPTPVQMESWGRIKATYR